MYGRCDTTRRTGNVVIAAVRAGGAADLQGIVHPSDTVCSRPLRGVRHVTRSSRLHLSLQVLAVWHDSISQGTGSDSWLIFDDEPGQTRLDHIDHLLQLGGPVGLRLCRCALPCTRPKSFNQFGVLALERLFCIFAEPGGSLARATISGWTGKRVGDKITLSSVLVYLGTSLAKQSKDCSVKRLRLVMKLHQQGGQATKLLHEGKTARCISNPSWAHYQQRTGGPTSEKN